MFKTVVGKRDVPSMAKHALAIILKCLECEKREEELHSKVNKLRKELKEAQRTYAHLLVESRLLDKVKPEEDVYI